MISSLVVLSIGSLFSGFVCKDAFTGVGSLFLGNSILVVPQHFNLLEAEFLPISVKLISVGFSLFGAFLAYYGHMICSPLLIAWKTSSKGSRLYAFLNQRWFLDKMCNVYLLKPLFYCSYAVPFRLLDKGFIELLGPQGLV